MFIIRVDYPHYCEKFYNPIVAYLRILSNGVLLEIAYRFQSNVNSNLIACQVRFTKWTSVHLI